MATGEVGLTKSGLDLTGTVGANVAITGTQQEQGTLVGGLSGGQMTTVNIQSSYEATGTGSLTSSGLTTGTNVQVGESVSAMEQGSLSYGGVTATAGAGASVGLDVAGSGNVSATLDNGNINLNVSGGINALLGFQFNAGLQIPTGPIVSGLTTVADNIAPAVQDAASTVGDAVSSAASDVGNALNPGRVICTHFFRKGMLDRATWRADLEFTFRYLSPTTVRGYQFWAIPYVRLMRRSPLAERLMYPVAKYRARELAHRMGRSPRGSLLGKVFRLVFEPACFCIGCFVGEQDWQSLWAGGELDPTAGTPKERSA
jgi:hypothetical protein